MRVPAAGVTGELERAKSGNSKATAQPCVTKRLNVFSAVRSTKRLSPAAADGGKLFRCVAIAKDWPSGVTSVLRLSRGRRLRQCSRRQHQTSEQRCWREDVGGRGWTLAGKAYTHPLRTAAWRPNRVGLWYVQILVVIDIACILLTHDLCLKSLKINPVAQRLNLERIQRVRRRQI